MYRRWSDTLYVLRGGVVVMNHISFVFGRGVEGFPSKQCPWGQTVILVTRCLRVEVHRLRPRRLGKTDYRETRTGGDVTLPWTCPPSKRGPDFQCGPTGSNKNLPFVDTRVSESVHHGDSLVSPWGPRGRVGSFVVLYRGILLSVHSIPYRVDKPPS